MKSILAFTSCAAVLGVLGGLGLVACGDPPPPKNPETTQVKTTVDLADAGVAPTTTTTTTDAKDAGATTPTEPPPPAKPTPAVVWKGVGLATPESVFYDATDDLYYVTNINGAPLAADNNGFISQLSPDGTVKNLKLIEGNKNKVTLNAPKGIVVTADMIVVTDLNTVRMFDKKTGAPKGEVKIPGSTFLNDIAVDAKGTFYVTDSGMKAGKEGFDPTGTDGVWSIDAKKKLTSVAKGKELNRPNGVAVAPDGKVWVNTFGAAELYWLGPKGEKKDVVMLPKINGLEVLDTLRKEGMTMPIIVLSARTGEMDKVTGLELGAEDYIGKPFSLAELLARVKAALRRSAQPSRASAVTFGDVVVDVDARVVRRNGAEVEMTATEFDVLLFLLSQRGKVLSRDAIFSHVWGPNHHGTPRTIDNFMQQLRAKLEIDPTAPKHFQTVRGVGYRFDG